MTTRKQAVRKGIRTPHIVVCEAVSSGEILSYSEHGTYSLNMGHLSAAAHCVSLVQPGHIQRQWLQRQAGIRKDIEPS